MAKPGRTSGAELAVQNHQVEKLDRPTPLTGLTTDQGDLWIDIVSDLPADWFPQHTHEILGQYCRHCISVRKLDQLISKMENDESFDVDEYDKLLKMRERESRAASSHATRLRLTPQATYDKSKKKQQSNKKLWT